MKLMCFDCIGAIWLRRERAGHGCTVEPTQGKRSDSAAEAEIDSECLRAAEEGAMREVEGCRPRGRTSRRRGYK
jgi:hypothetical protein